MPATRPAVVSFHFGLAPKFILRALQHTKVPDWASVARLSEALYTQQQGCSAIITQGMEAGGQIT
ncbi:nitronate monooxygenase [Rosenbergiella epipactidis]|uniref:nitronate monooxygenase n=1 Tax=Rosenbergiella epipactidis TaxID=1544694 RepID=UPI0030C8CBBB